MLNNRVYQELIKIIIISITMISIDYVYLNSISSHFKKLIKNIQDKPMKLDMLSSILCYISLVFSLYYFIIKDNKSYIDAAILGFVIYSVFEFTNKALFTKWTWDTVIIDSIWGAILFYLTTVIVYKFI
jgi:uncharacterized membrane protein